MKIGIGPYYYAHYGESGAERMRRHGFDYMDFDWYANIHGELYRGDDAEFVRHTEALAEKFRSEGYSVWQIHGPWVCPAPNATEAEREMWFGKCVRAIRAAKIIGAGFMAIHPLMPFGVDSHTPEQADELYSINLDFFRRLAPVAEEQGVTVCLENMPFPDFPLSSTVDIMRIVRAVNSPNFRVCLDTGHANVVGPNPAESVRLIGKDYLKILHVHGNDGKQDYHYNPMAEGDTVDWDAFSSALSEIGFEGVVSLETSMKSPYSTDAEREELEIRLANIAKHIAGIK